MNREDLSEGAIIFFIAVSCALLTNLIRSDSLPLVHPKPASVFFPTKNNQASTVSFQVLQEKFNKPGIILIDVRSTEEFKQGHIPWAINIPHHEFPKKSQEVMRQIFFSQEIIMYCGGIKYSDANDLAFLLKAKGYKDVKVYNGGWEEWTQNNMPVEKEEGVD